MAAPLITLAVGDWRTGIPDQQVTTFESGKVSLTMNDGAQVQFKMPARSPAALLTSGLATDVFVYRNGDPLQRFRVLPVPQDWDADGGSDVSITAVNYKRLMDWRFMQDPAPSFSNVDQGLIVWGLVDHTQSQTGGDLGITAGSLVTGQARDRTEYNVGDNIGQRLDELQNVLNGVWWDVGPDLVLNAGLQDDFPQREDPLVLGTQLSHLARSPGAMYANAAGAKGSDEGTVPTWLEHPDIETDPLGRWEAFDSSHGSVTEQDTVDEYAAGLLETRSSGSNDTWKFTMEPSRYFSAPIEPGEFCELVVPDSPVNEFAPPPATVIVQVTDISIGFDGDGGVSVNGAGVEVQL